MPDIDALEVTREDGETAAAIRAALYRAVPNIPGYPTDIIEPYLARHRLNSIASYRAQLAAGGGEKPYAWFRESPRGPSMFTTSKSGAEAWQKQGYEVIPVYRQSPTDAAKDDEIERLRMVLEKAVQWEQDFTDGDEAKHPWINDARALLSNGGGK